jgi:RNA polymerase sigma-70 factor (ECF subfamily)
LIWINAPHRHRRFFSRSFSSLWNGMVRFTPLVLGVDMNFDPSLQEALLAKVPALRAFAFTLCRTADGADDLVQETLMRALANIRSFHPGTNLTAWLFTILRNCFRSTRRKRWREVEDIEGRHAASLVLQPDQETSVRFKNVREALGKLPVDQREAVILICGSGLSYGEAAEICAVPVGTIRSRLHRGRALLAELVSFEEGELRPDAVIQAVSYGCARSAVPGAS